MNNFDDVPLALTTIIDNRKEKENLSFFEHFDIDAFLLAQNESESDYIPGYDDGEWDNNEEVYDTFVDVNARA